MGVQLDELQVGDEIQVVRRGVVKSVSKECATYDSGLQSGMWLWSDNLPDQDITIIKKAPKPFVVGELITPEMGEPPMGSIIRVPSGYALERRAEGWVAPSRYSKSVLTFAWERLSVDVAGGMATLLHLGK